MVIMSFMEEIPQIPPLLVHIFFIVGYPKSRAGGNLFLHLVPDENKLVLRNVYFRQSGRFLSEVCVWIFPIARAKFTVPLSLGFTLFHTGGRGHNYHLKKKLFCVFPNLSLFFVTGLLGKKRRCRHLFFNPMTVFVCAVTYIIMCDYVYKSKFPKAHFPGAPFPGN